MPVQPHLLLRAARAIIKHGQLHEQEDGRILVVLPYEFYERLESTLDAHDQEARSSAQARTPNPHEEHPGT